MSEIKSTKQAQNPVAERRKASAGGDYFYSITECYQAVQIFLDYAFLINILGACIGSTRNFSVAPHHIFKEPLLTTMPTTWFANSMSGLFGEGVADETISHVRVRAEGRS